ncbi:UDP-glucose 4-epimerase [Methylophilus rhizosphaerae]|uniref:UDP-glucose 4-epimerase n=1 Tax=Methylophilus rhizosphaerae TaxID=492660 RepID=A0A1G8ZAS9_9PROT|nr:NAD-dependent epimerase/dehydratase family protein [Methylophilus rhizosphaerae]SDK12182.1 UDP-glucose 4-epimerase [Methylophilus rhizosphaerae]
MHVLVTGASGFVGQALRKQLSAHGCAYTAIQREALDPERYSAAYDCIIHLAGRAHVMHDAAQDIYQAYAAVNIDFTLKVAELARQLKIRRFVFLSSIKVNGESSAQPFTETDTPVPLDAYGQTKLEAELALKKFCHEHGIELVIIRPPLIYGPGVKANFRQLIKLCLLPFPLPFASVKNKRSFVSLENLTDFITLCCTHPQAANQTFLIADDEDVSLTDLIRTIRSVKQQSLLLFSLPLWLLKILFTLLGKSGMAARLFGTLQADISKAKSLLGWQPKFSFREGIQQTLKEL